MAESRNLALRRVEETEPAAADRQKQIIPICLSQAAVIPPHIEGTPLPLPVDAPAANFETLIQRRPPPPRHTWLSEADILRPRLAELAYMDRFKLAELQHVA